MSNLSLLKEIQLLCWKDLRLEWRQRYALNGLLLYVCSTVFVVYMAFAQIEPITWITVLWIILLFASINAVAKSFMQESQTRQWYYYSLVSPQAVILSKIIYNILLLGVIAFLGIFVYSVLLGNPVQNWNVFILAVLLGAVSFSTTFTVVSAIAYKAGGGATLMPILSFPIIIPVIALLIAISSSAITDAGALNRNNSIGILIAINVILIVVSVVLFPYLWRD